MRKIIERAKKADAIWSLLQWPGAIIASLASLFGFSIMAFLTWWWAMFGPAGVIVVGLAGGVIFLICVMLYKGYGTNAPRLNAIGRADMPPPMCRISLFDFIKDAEKSEWDVSGKTNVQIMDLMDGLRQGGLDGVIQFWGRPDRNFTASLTRNEPLHEIAKDHWKEFEVETSSAVTAKENFDTHTYNTHGQDWKAGSYRDLYLDGGSARHWLKTEGQTWKGRRDAIEA